MDWPALMSLKRYRGPHEQATSDPRPDARSAFSKDADRIIYSSAFRRLQDKTQVHPFPETDYVRTRLTHCLEASSIGRSLGVLVGRYVLKKIEKWACPEPITPGHFGVAVETACLAHDLGNPPFGHAGEDAIRHFFWHWFRNKEGEEFASRLSKEERFDLESFEGNAQGFRILTRLQGWRDNGGLQLSCATIGSFMKYPCGSLDANATGPTRSRKKFGYFKHDREAWCQRIAPELGLIPDSDDPGKWCRHPLAFLVEAADDISYLIADIEDAYKADKVSFDEAEGLLRPIAKGGLNRYHLLSHEPDRVTYLRAKAIGVLVDEAYNAFWGLDEEIHTGQFHGNLLDHVGHAKEVEEMRRFCQENIYTVTRKLEMEAAGYEVIHGLLEIFTETVVDWWRAEGNLEKMQPKYRRTIQLLPSYLEIPPTPYLGLLRITDYVSGMTDSFAVRQYRKLKGFSIGLDRL